MTFILTFGQFAIFVHQLRRRVCTTTIFCNKTLLLLTVEQDSNSQHLIAWFAFVFGLVSLWALAKSVWGTIDVVRHGAGAVRLEEERGPERADG